MKSAYCFFFIVIFFFAHFQELYALNDTNDNPSFCDMSTIAPDKRAATSKIVQFCFTSQLNIGDYLPTLGIRNMLGQNTDLWNMHDRNIDFDFINKNYKCAIIGGAGLFHKGFEAFYRNFLKQCKIPLIVWGVGICLPNGKIKINEGVNKQIIARLEQRCELINVRDELTSKYYNLQKGSVSACPTIVYLQKFRNFVEKNSDLILYSSHNTLVPDEENLKIISTIKQNVSNFKMVNNIFSQEKKISEIEDIIMDYCKSKIIVTTRLHGAIIAYSLGIPYIIIPFDEKLRAFHQRYGNGVIANNMEELKNFLLNHDWISLKPIELKPVLDFGNQAKQWAENLIDFRSYTVLKYVLHIIGLKYIIDLIRHYV